MRESLPEFIQAFWLTLYIGFFGILFSCVLGLICALIEIRKTPILSQLSSIYIELSRNTPLLIQLFFLYFALPKIGIRLSSEVCAVIGLAFLGGSYMAETLRAGFLSVEKIQKESALSLGMSKMQMMAYVVLPQALSLSMPSLTANVIFLFKETSVFSAVALADLMFVAKDLACVDVFGFTFAYFITWAIFRKKATICRIWGLAFYLKVAILQGCLMGFILRLKLAF